MPMDRLSESLQQHVVSLEEQGTTKGAEDVITRVLPPENGRGPRFQLEGEGEKQFLRMNSNSYLGLSLNQRVRDAEEVGTSTYGAGPGAVRFISGTYRPHIELEQRLAEFHGREEGMIFSSAYAAVLSAVVALITDRTMVISDELNHNCIINAVRLARPFGKAIYRHLDMEQLEEQLEEATGEVDRVLVLTDGVFSMRGDHAPLDRIVELCERYDDRFAENVVLVVDDSHGVGALGETGRGTEELAGGRADVLVATLGKALGVNGGYVVSSSTVVRYLRETSPMYIYSNPITPGEASAATAALELLDSAEGRELLERLRSLTARFAGGLVAQGHEVIPGEHPVVPLMVRDTERTHALVAHLKENGVLATGLAYPVVPRGDEEIRFQINADHTADDIDRVLEVLESFSG